MKNKIVITGNYYDKHNSRNPLVKIIMGKFHRDLNLLIKKTNSNNLLDIGCGEGYTSQQILKENNLKISAVDLDEKMLESAKKIFPEINFSVSSIYKLNFKNETFDCVVATEVLEHLDNPEKGIGEAKRVSKKYCIFSVPNEPYWRMANILRLSYLKNWGNTPGHLQNWTKLQFKNLLKKNFKKVFVKQSTLWNIALCEK